MSAPDRAEAFRPLRYGSGEGAAYCPHWLVPAQDLFTDIGSIVSAALGGKDVPSAPGSPFALFRLNADTAVLVDLKLADPTDLQTFIVAYERRVAPKRLGRFGPPRSLVLDSAEAVTLWTVGDREALSAGLGLWQDLSALGKLGPAEMLTTPRLYGNKLRMAGFVSGILAAVADAGAPVLDAMAGTGVLSRTFADRHPVWVNDANLYAAFLSGAQQQSDLDGTVDELIETLRAPFAENRDKLQTLSKAAVEAEAGWLHGLLDEQRLDGYRQFVEQTVLPITQGGGEVHRLATERYANIYFGVAQSVEIDSLRAAIDRALPEDCGARTLCLNALLVAVCNCAGGPHFAQPLKLKSVHAMRTLIERRARSVSWEFELALIRLAARPALRHPFIQCTNLDWREALSDFARHCHGKVGFVYLDPPYSKLQYSRYYHLLNVLLEYDYPEVSGTGRYPARERRFSSRFEYQPGGARREFAAIIEAVANQRFGLILSYGERGFVSKSDLVSLLEPRFDTVLNFATTLRHHSQGRVLGRGPEVTENVFVGLP